MVERRQGRIINVASTAGTTSIPNLSAYVTSKTALIRLSEILAAEVAASDVRIFAIQPGVVKTQATEEILTSDAGRRWFPRFGDVFTEGHDITVEEAAAFVLRIGAGGADALSGGFVSVDDNLPPIPSVAAATQRRRVLRLRTFGEPSSMTSPSSSGR
jgi:NAD(P)-dependent dehydrogenase (short-subunit alcohol dehydrogenase family)